MKKYALIVAGGNGSRMGSETPKQFLLLKGKPVLMYTLQAFHEVEDLTLLLVLPEEHIETWKALCVTHHFSVPHEIIQGGMSRFHSVRNGLAHVPSESLVSIHDGVRPIIHPSIILNSFETAQQHGSAIAAVPLKDSIREQTITGETRNVNRSNYYLIQTPQTFQSNLIKTAYANATHENFTDDAGVAEEAKIKIRLIEGDYKNIKITTPEDLRVAELFLTP